MGTGWIEAHERASDARALAAQVDGVHYSQHVPEVRRLLRAKEDAAAAGLLLRLIDAIEREARIPLAGRVEVPPWYAAQLARIYARHGLGAEAERLAQRMAALQAAVDASGRAALKQMHDHVSTAALDRPGAAQRAGALLGRMVGWLRRP